MIITSEQIKYILGVQFSRQSQFYGTVYQLITHLKDVHLLTFGAGLVALSILYICKRLKRRFPYLEGPVILVALGTLCAWIFDGEANGIALVGFIPSGFPSPNIPIPAPSISSGRVVDSHSFLHSFVVTHSTLLFYTNTDTIEHIFQYYYQYTVELFPVSLALALVGYVPLSKIEPVLCLG